MVFVNQRDEGGPCAVVPLPGGGLTGRILGGCNDYEIFTGLSTGLSTSLSTGQGFINVLPT